MGFGLIGAIGGLGAGLSQAGKFEMDQQAEAERMARIEEYKIAAEGRANSEWERRYGMQQDAALEKEGRDNEEWARRQGIQDKAAMSRVGRAEALRRGYEEADRLAEAGIINRHRGEQYTDGDVLDPEFGLEAAYGEKGAQDARRLRKGDKLTTEGRKDAADDLAAEGRYDAAEDLVKSDPTYINRALDHKRKYLDQGDVETVRYWRDEVKNINKEIQTKREELALWSPTDEGYERIKSEIADLERTKRGYQQRIEAFSTTGEPTPGAPPMSEERIAQARQAITNFRAAGQHDKADRLQAILDQQLGN